MTQEEYMRRRRADRKKRRMVAYLLRGVTCLVLVGMIMLMGCGCLYIGEALGKEEEQVTAGTEALQLAAKPGQNAEKTDTKESSTEKADSVPDVTVSSTAKEDSAVEGTDASAVNGTSSNENMVAGGDAGYASSGKDPVKPSVSADEKSNAPKDGKIVVLDAGHGGNDGGTFSGDIIEKNINLAVAKKMQKLLEDQGITVVMTREADKYMKLEERTKVANSYDTDLFVSVHCNSYDADDSVYGMECYHGKGRKESLKCAEMIMDVIDECKDIRSRGPKEADYFVIQYSQCPAVLVEMGFLTNPKECEKLNSDEYQDLVSEELVEGIMDILEADIS